MLSIIISSYRENLFLAISKNIKGTIGNIEYEIIKILNPGKLSISEAYNNGAKIAKFDKLLFLHEDVEFLKKDWGQELIKLFELENLGILGLAGGKRKFDLPTGHDQGIKEDKFLFVSHDKDMNTFNSSQVKPISVETLDGVFLALTKRMWKELKFNQSIKGFHFYDLDISLRSSRTYQNYVIPYIPLLHFSRGNFNDDWIKEAIKFHKGAYNFDPVSNEEKGFVRKFWYRRLLLEDISIGNRLNYFLKLGTDGYSYKAAINFIASRRVF